MESRNEVRPRQRGHDSYPLHWDCYGPQDQIDDDPPANARQPTLPTGLHAACALKDPQLRNLHVREQEEAGMLKDRRADPKDQCLHSSGVAGVAEEAVVEVDEARERYEVGGKECPRPCAGAWGPPSSQPCRGAPPEEPV